jgi:ATP-binding cassette subfamily B protein
LSFVFIAYTIGILADLIIKPYLYKEIIDTLVDGGSRGETIEQVTILAVLVAVSILILNLGYRLGDFASSYFQSKIIKEIHDTTFGRLLRHSYHFFSNNFSGSIVAKAKRFARSFETFADVITFELFFSIMTLLGVIVVLLIKTPVLAYMFMGWSVIYVLVTIAFIKKKISYDSLEAEADSKVTARLADAILNVLNIKIFSKDKKEASSFAEITDDEERKRIKAWNFANIQSLTQSLLMGVLQIAMLVVTIRMWYAGTISIGMIVLVQTYMFKIFDTLWGLGRSLTRAIKALTEMQEVVEIFDSPIDVADPKKPERLKMREGHIKFDNITFTYKDGASVFKNFSLEINPGERIGIVGPSGAGKSTITKLLLRFSDLIKGKITIDGQDICRVTQNDLRSVISYVPQESILFHRSIKENIAYGDPDTSEDKVIEVAKKAHAHEFIEKLPQGYETLVGERGVKLSGGERQRVAIARAMLKDAPILLLDEATSSLDSVSEGYIQDSFDELMKGKTTLVIAHRLSTIQKMDRIVVLRDGNIEEIGDHKTLLANKGLYADLWNRQSGGFIE